MKWWWGLLCTKPTRLVGDFNSASSLKQQSSDIHVAPFGHIILIPSQSAFALSHLCCKPSRKATNTNFVVFGLTRPGKSNKDRQYNGKKEQTIIYNTLHRNSRLRCSLREVNSCFTSCTRRLTLVKLPMRKGSDCD
jgi:hypothetical protein